MDRIISQGTSLWSRAHKFLVCRPTASVVAQHNKKIRSLIRNELDDSVTRLAAINASTIKPLVDFVTENRSAATPLTGAIEQMKIANDATLFKFGAMTTRVVDQLDTMTQLARNTYDAIISEDEHVPTWGSSAPAIDV